MLYLLKRYYECDPSARSYLEIALPYPGIRALLFYKIARFFHKIHAPFLPRLFTEVGRFLSGIEIHHGAKIGRALFIDHGMGVVIGETAVIGNDVMIYQNVTLGGTELKRGEKRHPTIEDGVVIGAGAKVLGNITVGIGSRIGAASVVIESVPPHSTAVGNPARVINRGIEKGEELSHQKIKE